MSLKAISPFRHYFIFTFFILDTSRKESFIMHPFRSTFYFYMIALIAGFLLIAPMTAISTADDAAPAKTDNADTSKESKTAASVNGETIPMAVFSNALRQTEQQHTMRKQGAPLTDEETLTIKKDVLNMLINNELVYQKCVKDGIKVEDKLVDERMETFKNRYPSQEEFAKALQLMNVTEDEIKHEIKKGLYLRTYIEDNLKKTISIDEKEVKDFYDKNTDIFKMPEKVRASHILITVPQNATDEQKKESLTKIQEIQKEVKEGKDFAELAKEKSACPSAKNGGDLNYFGKGQMVKPFEDAAFALKVGEVSDIVETQFGYHLIKLTDKQEAGIRPFDEVKENIDQHLVSVKLSEVLDKMADTLKKDAKIETFVTF